MKWALDDKHTHELLSLYEQAQSSGKQVVVFLDYDGTLTPIVSRPELAILSQDMRDALRQVASTFRTAIVSGRAKDNVKQLISVDGLYYAGSHGFDIEKPKRFAWKQIDTNDDNDAHDDNDGDDETRNTRIGIEFVPILTKLYETLCDRLRDIDGVILENNIFSLSVHYRLVKREDDVHRVFDTVSQVIKEEEYAKGSRFEDKVRITQGKMVIEVRANYDWHKGKAVVHLLESMGLADPHRVFATYIGDDKTDEDAFRALEERGFGIGILVAPDDDIRIKDSIQREHGNGDGNKNAPTAATWYLKSVDEVCQFLYKLPSVARADNSLTA